MNDKFIIGGGHRLNGTVRVPSAKNACLPLLAASILTQKSVTINNISYFSDIHKMCDILSHLGCKLVCKEQKIIIDSSNLNCYEIPHDLMKESRASIFLLGPLLARLKHATVTYPGGCDIGARPIDIHIKGLKNLNANIIEEGDHIIANGDNMRAGNVEFSFASVGATENIIMTAVLLKGTTKIFNAAREPEIVDLANFINTMGGKIYGAGTSTITVEGVNELTEVEYTPIPDRIITGTYAIMCAVTGGKIEITNCNSKHIQTLIDKLINSSCNIECISDKIYVQSCGTLKAVKFTETKPYPGFATDLQAPFMAAMCKAHGTSIIVENLYEMRYKHASDFVSMGADIEIVDRTAIIRGVKNLYGTEVYARDLRGAAALVTAGLCAEGTTTIDNISVVDRGYDQLELRLRALSADIKRVSV
ncbi:MAG: UDP-N-acetylglucosamine 1-carboxyvinyltransferase [Clostridia bacterium]|jgi:UDP-N-acetylglucosamine 1-carboxyvinyltransferase|nr:UDP-N-acetylglucosamine 1-carboxyvinyltransferase [Clostridia bacterium]MDD4275967.1 UDP-N-acetylglucosamine 1-carboxyvinyltransferase [Clostridia bacterium]